jgi:hypothetical protein
MPLPFGILVVVVLLSSLQDPQGNFLVDAFHNNIYPARSKPLIAQTTRRYETYCRIDHNIICWNLRRTSLLSTRLYDSDVSEAGTMMPHSLLTTAVAINGASPLHGSSARTNGVSSTHTLNNNDGHHHVNFASNGAKETANEDEVPMPTDKGGFSHTSASRAKIGAANKGKIPWNKGREQSPEVRARIAAGVRATNRERFLQKLQDQGLTEKEYDDNKKSERRIRDAERRNRRTEKGGYRPTEETKLKISQILKAKYAKGEIKRKAVDPSKVRRGFTHTDETKKKISESLQKRWAEDPDYRENMVVKAQINNSGGNVRSRISTALKEKWKDPEFRARMMGKIANRKKTSGPHDVTHREKISRAMKAKWQDPQYKQKILISIAGRQSERGPAIQRKPKKTGVKKVRSDGDDQKVKLRVPKGAKEKLRAPKGAEEVSMHMVEPIQPGEKRIKKVIKSKRKKTIQILEDSNEPVQLKAKKTRGTAVKKVEKEKVEVKEPDGSVNRLREERRDLFDLLYGDEDPGEDENENEAPSSSPQESMAYLTLGDENLDDFDPYGLEDH